MNSKLSTDLKKLANTQVIAPLTKHLNTYEKRARQLVKELDVRSRGAREKSRVRFEELLVQIKKTRTELEAKVRGVLEEESKRFNVRVNDLLDSLTAPSKGKKASAKGRTAKSTKGAKTASKARKGTSKTGRASSRSAKAKLEDSSVVVTDDTHATTH